MKSNTKRKITLLVLVVAAAAGLWYVTSLDVDVSQTSKKFESEQIIGQPIEAASGELIQGFPRDLILDKQGTVVSSSVTPYEENHKQYTATYTTSRTVEQEYNNFVTYLEKNKFKVTKKEMNQGVGGIYAEGQYADANVVVYLDPASGKNTVIISYLLKR